MMKEKEDAPLLIPVLIEPNYTNSVWAVQAMEGLNQEAIRKKYRVLLLDPEKYQKTDYVSLFADQSPLVIILGPDMTWVPGALSFFSEKHIPCILVCFDPAETYHLQGMVRMDYIGATHAIMTYLKQCGREKIALYGFNPASSPDRVKQRYFESSGVTDGGQMPTVFPNYGSLDACYRSFLPTVGEFDAAVCANDIVAVSLMRHLKRDGIRVPEDLFLVGFGDSLLARAVTPSITSASLDHTEMGRQAAALYGYLSRRQQGTASVSVRVKSTLHIGGSTAFMPYRSAGPELPASSEDGEINFYDDPEVEALCRLETLLGACDKTDCKLLRGMLNRTPVRQLEGEAFITASALAYRKKRIQNLAGCQSMAELQDFLQNMAEIGLSFDENASE